MPKASQLPQSKADTGAINLHKPLVKDYIDPDLELDSFIKLHLPHIAYSIPDCRLLYKSSDGKTIRYRVNWWKEDKSTVNFITTSKIVHSALYQVSVIKNGYSLKEL